MPISFVRIDDRVIHGQVVARWSRFKPCNGILVIDDKIAADPLQKRIFSNSAPTGVKVGVYTVEEGLEKISKAKVAKNSYFVIVKTPVTLMEMIEKGGDIGLEVNVGPLSARSNAKTVAKNVAITVEEKNAFDFLDEKGLSVNFQLIPDETAINWKKIRQNY